MQISTIFHHAYILLVLVCSSIPSFAYSMPPEQSQPEKPEVWLNIFLHGIISIKPYITVTNFLRFLSDNVNDSIYAETVAFMRDDPYFYQNQPMQRRGLHPIELDNHTKGSAASALANIYAMANQINTPSPTAKNYYYTYGWSGLLSRKARCDDAREFWFAIEKEVSAYKARGIQPKIRLLGYSHGGTVILKLAMIKQKENLKQSFNVDEAFLFGTPIQFDTDYFINDPLFKKVYNVFSSSDRAQKLDFFSSGEFFSGRIFKSHCDFIVPDKLVQIEIRVVRKKGETCCDQCKLPPISYGKKYGRNLRNVSPGHTEFWFFGWTPHNYRKTFPLYPMPVVALIPFIANSIKPLESNFKAETPITITIDVYRNSMVINNNLKCPQVYTLPFMGIHNFLRLKEAALQFKPDPVLFNTEIYDEHIIAAYDKGVVSVRERKRQRKIDALAKCVNNRRSL